MSQQDAAFMRTFVIVLGLLVAFAIVIGFLAALLGEDVAKRVATNPEVVKATEERIAPLGSVRIEGQAEPEPASPPTPAEAAPAVARSAEDVYRASCFACHGTGAAGAPKTGDAAAWEPRAAQGFDTLVAHASNGFKAMPARGAPPVADDEELKAAVVYMLEQAGLSAGP